MSDVLVSKTTLKQHKFPGHCHLVKNKTSPLSGQQENPFFTSMPTKSILSSFHNTASETGSQLLSDETQSPTRKVTFKMDKNSETNLTNRLQDRDLVEAILALTECQEQADDQARESHQKYRLECLREAREKEGISQEGSTAENYRSREGSVYFREGVDDDYKETIVSPGETKNDQPGDDDAGEDSRRRRDTSRDGSEDSMCGGSVGSIDLSDCVSDDSRGSLDTNKGTQPCASRAGNRMSHLRLYHSTRTTSAPKEMQRSISNCVELVKLHFSDVENRLFEMFGNKQTKTINVKKFLAGLLSTGLRSDDPRLGEMYENVQDVKRKINKVEDDSLVVDYHTFMGIISDNLEIVVRAFSHSFIIPEFQSFCDQIDVLYQRCRSNEEGQTAEYIPQLSRMNKNFWAVSLCTVDGQRYSVGDVKQPFTIQSCSKPLTYAVACADNGPETMAKYIGLEPSGRFFNELCLDYKNKPHNPMINSGAIMTAALVKPEFSAADRFDYMFEMYKRLAGGEYLGFNNSVFLSEKECADRNFALAYFMRENKCFPPGTKLQETLEFYFQLCSLEITAESGAVMAATLANGGINPLTGDPVLTCEAVRNTLTLMHSCGMYNYSGQFAFKVGLPAKSGVSGCVLLVVPNTLGICLWSPALDVNGNSCRGVQFCSELVDLFRFHHFDNLRGNSSTSTKIDPRVTKTESSAQILFDLLFCVAANDISSLRRHALAGTDLESADYDGRTALHVASSEGHVELVEFLLEKCQANPAPKDRWQRTPLDDARNFGHPLVEKLLVKFCQQRGLDVKETQPTDKVNRTTKSGGKQ